MEFEQENESRSIAIVLVQEYLPSELVCYQLADIQSQARTLVKLIQFDKTLEDEFCLVCRDAGAGISHGEADLTRIFREGAMEMDLALACVLAGIGEVIYQYLLNSSSVRHYQIIVRYFCSEV